MFEFTLGTLVWPIIALVITALLLLVASYVFWIMMLIDACKRGNTQWIILFIVFFFLGYGSGIIASFYYFMEYRKNR